MNKFDLKQYQLITFDLDDTLWDCWPVIEHAEKTLFGWLRQYYPKITQGQTLGSMREYRLQMVKETPSYQFDLSQLRIDSLKKLAIQHNYSTDLAQDAFTVFIEARNEVHIYSDAYRLLKSLSHSTIKLASVTNGNADTKKIKIDHFFDISIKAEDVEKGKPYTDMFDVILEELAIKNYQCLHIGDDAYSDGLGAQNAGIDFCWLNRKGAVWPDDLPKPTYEITSFDGLV